MNSEPNELEHEVMKMMLAGDAPSLQILAEQFRVSEITTREFTGVGFFTTFSVPSEAPRLACKKSLRFGDVTADIEGLEHGAGFVLFINNGRIDFLEGCSYDERWPETIDRFRLSYIGGSERDLAALWRE